MKLRFHKEDNDEKIISNKEMILYDVYCVDLMINNTYEYYIRTPINQWLTEEQFKIYKRSKKL